jgi:hypothetical protein
MVTALLVCALWVVLTKGNRIQTFCFLVLLLLLRWIVFDIALNFFRNLPLDYIDLPDKDDALLDSMPYAWHFGLKAVVLTLSVAAFLWSAHRENK